MSDTMTMRHTETDAKEAAAVSRDKARRSRKARTRLILFSLVPVALAVGAYAYVNGGQVMTTDNAYIEADMVGVTTDVSGIVKSVDVHEGETVKPGQVLFTLDPRSFQAAVDGDQARLDAARNTILNLQQDYLQALAELAQAKADLPYYESNFKRQQTLQNTSVSSQSSLDDATHALVAARQKVDVAEAAVKVKLAALGNRPDAPVDTYPAYQEAKAALTEARRELDHTVVRAPFGGIVTNVSSLQVGSYLAAAQAGFQLVSDTHMWIDASPKETELTYVRPGQDAVITVDSYPGVEWHGKVESVSPASASSFSLLPAQNSSGNWVKVVQRIPMRISVEDSANKPPLRVGMSTEVSIDTGHRNGLPLFVRSIFGGTTAYADERVK
ncbi:HlyD family secretion protein [Allorhizobium sp. BGMRC 0089]|uniref:HlyD family secretion protein n=1 Tax=Allorhizobium sonneratiae TaxID=2934936 RepID=UPI0020341C59|nr:HlyD family secretion protein [Allorhizobium sonneratiae]MCM2294529.1 HlyD family secretion protein [Allorhizobium sonneratiae]